MKSLSRKETSSWRSCSILVWLLLKKYFVALHSTLFNRLPAMFSQLDVSTTFAFVCLQVSLNQPLILCKVLNVLWQVLCWGKFRMVVKKCLDPKNCVISFIFSHEVYVVCVMILRLTTPRSPANNAVPLSRPWAHWTWSFKWQLCTAHEPPFLQAWFPSYPTHLLWLPRSKAN